MVQAIRLAVVDPHGRGRTPLPRAPFFEPGYHLVARGLATLQASQVVLPQVWFLSDSAGCVDPMECLDQHCFSELLNAVWSNQDFDPFHFQSFIRARRAKELLATGEERSLCRLHGLVFPWHPFYGWPNEAHFADSMDWLPWQHLGWSDNDGLG